MTLTCGLNATSTPAGFTIDSTTCMIQADGTVTAGTYFMVVEWTDSDLGTVVQSTAAAVTVDGAGTATTTISYGPGSLGACGGEVGCLMNQNGVPYATAADVDGNLCVVVPSVDACKISRYDSTAGEAPDDGCCTSVECTGWIAIDTSTNCVTHICDGENQEFVSLCSTDGTPVTPTSTVCYDLTSAAFPLCLGGGTGSWATNSGIVLDDIVCDPGGTNTVTATGDDAEFSCDYSNTICGAQPPSPATLNWAAPPTGVTTMSATGDPAQGWPCIRPTMRQTFTTMTSTAAGDFTIDFDVPELTGCSNIMLYDPVADTYLEVTTFTDPTGVAFVTGPGNTVFAINGSAGTGSTPYSLSVVFDGASVTDASQLEVHTTAVGNHPGNNGNPTLEEFLNVTLTGQVTTSATDCCTCYATLAEVAAALTANDPDGATWAVQGNQVCTTVATAESGYGDLTFCSGVFPVSIT